MKKIKLIFLLLASLCIVINGQENLTFDFDYAQFGYDSTSNYLEVYYSFNKDKLTKFEENGKNMVAAYLSLVITSKSDSLVYVNKKYKFRKSIADSNSALDNSLLGVLAYVLPKGEYFFQIEGTDSVDVNRKKSYSEEFTVEPFIGDKIFISNIQLATHIKNEGVNKNSLFYKNTLEVYPNPSIVYSNKKPVLFFYTEIYNLLSDTTKNEIQLNQVLLNSRGQNVFNKRKTLNRVSESRVEVGLINLNKLPTDTYTFVVGVADSVNNTGRISTKKFFHYNPGVEDSTLNKALSLNYISSEFGILTAEECDHQFEIVMYIANSNEVDQYYGLDSLAAKREFLFKFWKNRDSDIETPVNEFRKLYLNRYEIANLKYSTIQRKGWKTDRGRVLMVYGEPDQVEYHPNETDSKPYEIWQYNSIEGGVIFVFADLTNFGDYELIHSDKRGELRDTSWPRRIQKN